MKQKGAARFLLVISFIFFFNLSIQAQKEEFDIIIENGRIMDPLTRANFIGLVGIKDGTIVEIVPLNSNQTQRKKLKGDITIDAKGLVVAPGFIDIHTHEGILSLTMESFIKDGRTTMIGGNCGGSAPQLERFFRSLERRGCLINYASFAGHGSLRMRVGAKDRYSSATEEQIEEMVTFLEEEMKAGALGVSYGIHYIPGSSYDEILRLAQVSAKYGGMTAAHGRYGESTHLAVYSLYEMVRLTKDTGIPHQYSHFGSMLGYGDVMDEALDLLEFAQSKGLRILADIYSYAAWNTGVGAAILDEGFFERMQCKPEDLEVLSTVVIDGKVVMKAGQRFTQELYDLIRPKVLAREIPDPAVIGHVIKPEKIKLAMQSPYVVCGSDGVLYKDPHTKKPVAHPRATNNFARFLGHWVREKGTVDLMTALFKTSTQSAIHLGLVNKGRIAVGADADITIFNPDTIIDKGEYGEGFINPPVGIESVIVNGVLSVKNGELIPEVKAGKVIRRTWKIPGYSKE